MGVTEKFPCVNCTVVLDFALLPPFQFECLHCFGLALPAVHAALQ